MSAKACSCDVAEARRRSYGIEEPRLPEGRRGLCDEACLSSCDTASIGGRQRPSA